jgi:soluble lytic murein transglycosylase
MRLPRLALVLALVSSGTWLAHDCAGPALPTKAEAPASFLPSASDSRAGVDNTRRFRPDTVRLDESSPERQIQAALENKENARAREIGEAALLKAGPSQRGRLLWLLARSGPAPDAIREQLSELKRSEHPLGRWAGLRLVEGILTHTPAQAATLAEDLTEGWAGAARARQLQAIAYYKSGNFARAEPLLRELVERSPDDSASANLTLPLADILSKRSDLKSLKQALSLCRRVSARAIGSDTASVKRADELAKLVLTRMSRKDRALLSQPTIAEELARGEALMNAKNYEAAVAQYDKLAKRVRGDRESHCKIELEAGRALFYKRDRDLAAKRLAPLSNRCRDPEIKAWSRYYAGSARQRTGDPMGAITEYEALLRQTGKHAVADDALHHLAVAYQDAGDEVAMRKTLERLIESYPRGDMRTEARFSLMLAARADTDYVAALDQLERLLAEGPGEISEGLEGRSLYWHARTLQDLGRMQEAKAGYVALARALPLSYYAQQALARLSEFEPSAATMLLSELTDSAEPPAALTFRWRHELDTPSFETALDLLRVGEVALAKHELTWLGALGERADREMLWLVAAMLHEVQAHTEVVQLSRVRLRGFRSVAPHGRSRQLWRIAYPRAFSPLIEQAAAEAQVPPEFVRAIAREESSFNPSVVSTALAYGLIQLIRPTARIYAQPLGLPSDPDSLRRPEINVRIGSAFMRDLWRRYPKNTAIVPAAYNAGYNASDRWLVANAGRDLDEWVERIPYRETRKYTRRVLQTYGIYSWLDTGKLPPLPAALPAAPIVVPSEPPPSPDPAEAASVVTPTR